MLINMFMCLLLFFVCYSASGTSAVAIDNKIEQAMVSHIFFIIRIVIFIILVEFVGVGL